VTVRHDGRASAPEPAKRILVVDDTPSVAGLLVDALEAGGYAVDQAGDGAEALQMIRKRPYDAVVCDVVMPVLDGFGLYREIRSFDPDLCRRFAFMAGGADAVDQLEGSGVPVLAKPFKIDEAEQIVRDLLGG